MTELLTAAQMRAIEQAEIESGEVTGLELMERAGQGVVEAVLDEWPDLAKTAHRAVVLCGPGNNGGDGFVVARLLHERGWEVEVFLYGDANKLPPDARVNYERWAGLGEVSDIMEAMYSKLLGGHNKKTRRFSTPPVWSWGDAIVIDAVFGTGLTRPLAEDVREIFYALGGGGTKRLVAVDIPTGLSSDTGQIIDFTEEEMKRMWEAVPHKFAVDLTVTFHRMKRGHSIGVGPERCGKIVVADIGLKPWGKVRNGA